MRWARAPRYVSATEAEAEQSLSQVSRPLRLALRVRMPPSPGEQVGARTSEHGAGEAAFHQAPWEASFSKLGPLCTRRGWNMQHVPRTPHQRPKAGGQLTGRRTQLRAAWPTGVSRTSSPSLTGRGRGRAEASGSSLSAASEPWSARLAQSNTKRKRMKTGLTRPIPRMQFPA